MRYLAAFVLLSCLTWPAVSAQSKIGVVNVNEVIRNSNKGKEFFASINVFINSKRAEIENMVESLKQRESQAQASSLSDAQRAAATREVERLRTDIKRAQEDAELEKNTKLQDGGRMLEKELSAVIRQLSDELGLDLVLSLGPDSGILHFSQPIDLTSRVLEKYNQTGQ